MTFPSARLVDRFGRVHTDLRLSVTDRCSLRCTYCMPAEGVSWLPRSELLTSDEIVRLVGIAVRLGINSVRITGGEPLIRPHLVRIVAALAALRPRPELSITTNGLRLAELAGPLREAGLNRVNVSLDTIRPETFHAITRRRGLRRVLRGLAAAVDAGLEPVKVNAVLIRGVNDDQACELLRFCLEHGYELRFIESMPLDGGHAWRRESMVTAEEILQLLRRDFELSEVGERGSAPAETWWVDGGPRRVGVIAAVTKPFCAACNRLRLTADGQVRNCLFARRESDLRTLMRSGASDAVLAHKWLEAVEGKVGHHGIDTPNFVPPARPMSAIGG